MRVPTRPSPISIKHGVRRLFVKKWLEAVNDQPKLRFYKLLKSAFAYEPYLDLPNASWRKATSRLRGSSHTLNIETGRYIDQSDQRLRLCEFCHVASTSGTTSPRMKPTFSPYALCTTPRDRCFLMPP